MAKVKICGLTNLDDALIAQDAGADFLGFIFAESPRRIEADGAGRIIARLSDGIKVSALFVNEEKEKVDSTIQVMGRVDILQFHGDETPQYCSQFKGREIIKAFRIKDEASLERIKDYRALDYLLLDSFSKDRYGGTGQGFDWNLALKVKSYNVPIFLAGGLNPDNVGEAIIKVRPFAVDVTSGVEKEPGKKDAGPLRRFIAIAKSI